VVLISFAVVFIPILGIHGGARAIGIPMGLKLAVSVAAADAVGTTAIPTFCRESTTVSPEVSGRTLAARRKNVKPKHLKPAK
jgi:multidrug efflux pump subunit AcrB